MGPRAGISEIALPAATWFLDYARQDKSIRSEMVNRVCYQVIGCDTTICVAAEAASSSST
jgi:aspartate ammonia-lyase